MGKLSLSRKPGESFVIYDRNDGAFTPIVVTLEKGHRGQISIEAPPNIGIARSELFEQRKATEAETC